MEIYELGGVRAWGLGFVQDIDVGGVFESLWVVLARCPST